MRKYTPEELEVFLTAVDANLKSPTKITVMGGGAIALAHGVDRNTSDIDTLETNLRGISRAVEKAQEETGLNIEVSGRSGAVGDAPWHSDERLIRVLPELEKLQVYALEEHDVALSKTLRGHENDFAAIEKLHKHVGLNEDVLVHRYLNEVMGHVMGNPKRLDLNFVLLIDRLYGEISADHVRQLLKQRGR